MFSLGNSFLIYENGIKNDNIQLFYRNKNLNEKSTFINFPILIKEGKKKIFSEYLYKNNIDHAKYFYRSCDAIECFKDLGDNCINSQFISKNIILLPIHKEIDCNKIKKNIDVINLFLK